MKEWDKSNFSAMWKIENEKKNGHFYKEKDPVSKRYVEVVNHERVITSRWGYFRHRFAQECVCKVYNWICKRWRREWNERAKTHGSHDYSTHLLLCTFYFFSSSFRQFIYICVCGRCDYYNVWYLIA